jgi:hypothetical protein
MRWSVIGVWHGGKVYDICYSRNRRSLSRDSGGSHDDEAVTAYRADYAQFRT